MTVIKCPHCESLFELDENKYTNIINQIKNEEFNKELHYRLEELSKLNESDFKIREEKNRVDFEKELFKKEQSIQELKLLLENYEKQKELDILEHTKKLEEKILNQDKKILEIRHIQKEKDLEINKIKETNQLLLENEINKILFDKNKEIENLNAQLKVKDYENELEKKSLVDKYTVELSQKDEAIAFYKDFKLKQSTKLLGESLEKHCEVEFNKLRMTAFNNAQFYKDNDASSGSKGDYIYKEFDEDGIEIISIMFEMKNENDASINKKKNENFFKELDKDRKEKSCEYAVLVSTLEADNELYNNGIVDVSYLYDKMYVVRPQFFIPIITLLRNAAKNSLKYKKDLEIIKNQNIDISNFENELNSFKEKFSRNYTLASKKFKLAIEEIDKTITHLQKTKDALISSDNNLRLANNKIEDVTIKKLTKNNPTMKEKFDSLS